MALSFLYLAFVRILEVLRLARCESGELAVEVVVLRHVAGVPPNPGISHRGD